MTFKTKCLLFYTFNSILTIVNSQAEGSSNCNVKEVGSGLEKPCQFPFVYNKKSYNNCTLEDGNGIAWCSTRIDPKTNQHIGGNGYYGDCTQECLFEKWLDQNSLGKLNPYLNSISVALGVIQ